MPRRRYSHGFGVRRGGIDRIGIAWFDRNTHACMQEILLQPHDIPWLYERWLERAENRVRIHKTYNRLVLKIVIDPDVFLAWCTDRSVAPDGAALGSYVEHRYTADEYRLHKSPARPVTRRRSVRG